MSLSCQYLKSLMWSSYTEMSVHARIDGMEWSDHPGGACSMHMRSALDVAYRIHLCLLLLESLPLKVWPGAKAEYAAQVHAPTQPLTSSGASSSCGTTCTMHMSRHTAMPTSATHT
jgi:hypothetical protein